MRVLVAVTLYGHAKDYVLPKFAEMLEACVVASSIDADIVFYGDREPPNVTGSVWQRLPPPGGKQWAEDMLMESRQKAFYEAIVDGYDVLMLHGVDALWESRADFESIVGQAFMRNLIIAPLITARADANQLILRRFKPNTPYEAHVADYGEQWSDEQEDVPVDEVEKGGLIDCGFPGADNIAIPSSAFGVPFNHGHDPWYVRTEQGRPNVCVEEEWVRRALNHGHRVVCDTGILIHHVHEDGVARRWRGVLTPLDHMHWTPELRVYR